MKKQKIVFIGSGYVSVWAFKKIYPKLKSQIKNGEIEITLLSKTKNHDFHGFTGEFISGFLPLKFRSTPREILFKHSKYIQGSLTQINADNNNVVYKDVSGKTGELEYDHLVVGSGSYDHFNSIEGATDFGLSVKKEQGIALLRQKLVKNLVKAELSNKPDEIERLLNFTIIGAGLAGVEVCGNIVETLTTLTKEFPVLKREGFNVNLVYTSDDILPQLNSKKILKKYSLKTIKKLGVHLYPKTRVKTITEDKVIFTNNDEISTSFVVCTMGQTIDVFNDSLKAASNLDARIVVKPTLQSTNYHNIWSGGDAAIVKRPYFDGICNRDALWAIKHGSRIGKNLSRVLNNKSPGNFKYPGLGITAAFKKNKAILEIYNFPVTGRLAYAIRIGFFLYFMPSRKIALNALKSIVFDQNQSNENWQNIIHTERKAAGIE